MLQYCSQSKLVAPYSQFRTFSIMSAQSSWTSLIRPYDLNSHSLKQIDNLKKFDQLNVYWKERNFILHRDITKNIAWLLTTESTAAITTTITTATNPKMLFVPNAEEMKQLKSLWYSNKMPVGDIMWNLAYDALVCYGRIHGTCNIENNYCYQFPNGGLFRFSQWLHIQRILKAQNQLQLLRLTKLQLLVDNNMLSWELDPAEVEAENNVWNFMYNLLLNYGERNNGDYNVPITYKITLPDDKGKWLGPWLRHQRKKYKSGNLAQDRLDRLQGLVDQGRLLWDATRVLSEDKVANERWNEKYVHLLEYGEKYNHYNVPTNFIITLPDNTEIKLGQWLHYQRMQYRLGSLSPNRLDRLQKLVDQNKLLWDATDLMGNGSLREDDIWNGMYYHLLEYGVKNNGNFNVPYDYTFTLPDKTEVVKLGVWLSLQRKKYQTGNLARDKMDRLRGLVNRRKLDWKGKRLKLSDLHLKDNSC